jgi:hypothetical protein
VGKVKHKAGRVLIGKQNSKHSGPRHEIDGVGKLYASLECSTSFRAEHHVSCQKTEEGRKGPKRAERS